MATYFWVGGTGTYDGVATTHIAASSGGAGGAGPPVAASDTLKVDANSGGGTITITAATFPALDCSGAPATTITIGAATVDFKGTWVLVANITLGLGTNTLRMNAASGATINWTFGGCTVTGTGTFAINGGSTSSKLALQDDGTFPGTLSFLQGQLLLGTSHTLSVDKITGGGVTLMTLDWGTNSILNLTSTAATTVADFAHIAMANSANGSALVISTTSTNNRSITGGARILPQIRYIVNGSTGSLTMVNGNTYAGDPGIDFRDTTNARSLILPAAVTSTFNNTNGLNAQGTAGKLMTVKSATGGAAATIALAAGKRLEVNYCSIQDLTGPGLTKMFAYNSTDVSGNTLISFVTSSVSDTETGAGADTNSSTTVTSSSSDTGSGADTDAGTTVTLSSTETGAGADTNSSTSVTLSDSDSGAGVDAESSTTVSFSSAETGAGVDAGAKSFIIVSADVGAGADVALTVVVITLRPSLAHIVAATDALLAMTAGQRAESVQFIVLDPDLNEVGELHPARDGMTVTHDSTRSLARTLEGLFLRWDQIGDLDTLLHRIRPEWVLQNGVTFPLGVFVFAHDPRSRHTLGADIHASLVDQTLILEQSDGLPASYPVGTNVGAALEAEWSGAGFSQFNVDATTVTIAAPTAWAPDVTRGQRMRDLSKLAGFLPPYFDNHGRGVSRAAPDLSIVAPTFRYLEGTTITRGSIVEDDDRLGASNRYVVVSTSGADAPIVGVYDLPASVPWSAARRGGIVISHVETIQGITDSAQAAAMAKSIAMSDPSLFTRVDFDASADPRHDSWDVLTYDGAGDELAYLETAWRLELRTGGRHHHSARRSLIDA